jgi:hypothetical protein
MKLFASPARFKITNIDSFQRTKIQLESDTQRIVFLIPVLACLCREFDGIEIQSADHAGRKMMLEKLPFPLSSRNRKFYEIISLEKKYFVVCDEFWVAEISDESQSKR